MARLCMSSKSCQCTSAALTIAASGAGNWRPEPNAVASGRPRYSPATSRAIDA